VSSERLLKLFADPGLGNRLTAVEGRASLIRDLGTRMTDAGWEWADQLYNACAGRIATGTPNLLAELRRFRAYSDPVEKKSLFFLALMRNVGVWKYPDDEHLSPPVDYHEVRGHLRLGTVRVEDPRLWRMIESERAVTAADDAALRLAVRDAICLLARLTANTPAQMHYLFWNVFRACCGREQTHCSNCPPGCSLPSRYRKLGETSGQPRRCLFAAVCRSAESPRKVLEHVFETDYY
jgi:hypothetical protein